MKEDESESLSENSNSFTESSENDNLKELSEENNDETDSKMSASTKSFGASMVNSNLNFNKQKNSSLFKGSTNDKSLASSKK
jgi:hypothetical protein